MSNEHIRLSRLSMPVFALHESRVVGNLGEDLQDFMVTEEGSRAEHAEEDTEADREGLTRQYEAPAANSIIFDLHRFALVERVSVSSILDRLVHLFNRRWTLSIFLSNPLHEVRTRSVQSSQLSVEVLHQSYLPPTIL